MQIVESMKKLGIGCGILVALGLLVLIVVAIAGGSYNRLVKLSQDTDKQWAQVQNVYQRRADLIPNLVATVSGAANFEKSTITEVTAAPGHPVDFPFIGLARMIICNIAPRDDGFVDLWCHVDWHEQLNLRINLAIFNN